MQTEFEATFPNIDKDKIRQKLKKLGAKLTKPEFIQRRFVFNFPKGHEIKGGWLRVRDEKDRITMSLKIMSGNQIHHQKELELEINDFETAREFLVRIGCIEKAYQENKRELWELSGIEVTIDEWPFLDPFVEIEAGSEVGVRKVSERLGFKWKDAVFGPVGVLVKRQYGIPDRVVNDETSRIVFGGKNPWEEWLKKNKQRKMI